MIIGGINTVSQELANIYKLNNQIYADTLTRIASGKKIQKPSDDFAGYIRSRSMQTDINDYQDIKENLYDARGAAVAAVEAGNQIYEDLTRMKELINLYWGTSDTDEQDAYEAEFDAIADGIDSTIANTYYEGVQLVQTGADIKVVDLDPSGTGQLTVAFAAGDIVNMATPDIDDTDLATALATLNPEIVKATSYSVKAENFVAMFDNQIDITDSIIQSKQTAKALITDIDEAEETANSIDQSIRQQASIAMLTQANLSRQAVLQLYLS